MSNPSQSGTANTVFSVLKLIAVLFLFLVSLDVMSGGFKLFGKESAENLLLATNNPFIGLFIGMLATAIIQSSSTTTSMIVLTVAAGSLTLEHAVPMIMGANIGTSVTSTIVSLGHIGNRQEYQKAVSAATVHDFFNIITVVIVFTLEVLFGVLSDISSWVASLVTVQEGETVGSVLFFIKDSAKWLISLTATEGFPKGNPWLTALMGMAGLFVSLNLLTQILKQLVIGNIERNLNRFIFGSPLKALFTGFAVTTAVQSSSVTTSLMVPLVATDKVTLSRVFPFLMGANIGTTTTALLAAIFVSTDNAGLAQAGLAIAFAHLFFNCFGVLVLFPFPRIRQIPIALAEGLGRLTLINRLYGVAYVVVTFFLIPFTLIMLFR